VEQLMATIRPQFRSQLLIFAADDPVFGTGVCHVQQCQRPTRGRGLCQGHFRRWIGEGRPAVDVFAASTDPRWQRQRPNATCKVPGCGYGTARGGLCVLHGQQWNRAGRPDQDTWMSELGPIRGPVAGAVCRIAHCQLWPHAALPFCHAHAKTWKINGRPDVDTFAKGFAQVSLTEDQIVRLDQLGRQLSLELQYALQCRNDERASKTFPAVVMQVVRFLATTTATSLLDETEDTWRARIGRPAPKDSSPRALLVYSRRKVEDLADAGGWDAEYPREVWQLRRLGFSGDQALRFDAIAQPWLRELVKRWLRWQLGTGLGLEVARRGLRSLTRFARFCDNINVPGLLSIDRSLLERYLADLHAEFGGRSQQGVLIGQLQTFLDAVRQHHWAELAPTAMLFSNDYPKRAERLPRALTEQVMAQVEAVDNLNQWTNPCHRLVTVILIRCGLRVTDALRLEHDCIVTDAEGAPYLRYCNHKMKRQALVPIDEELQQMIVEQQARVTTDLGAAVAVLFPRATKNPDGQAPMGSATYRCALYRWLQHCDVRNEHGQAVHLTPHQWRHTLGTRLINRDVPQEVVRRILDHDSPEMTAHYARLHDTTIRRHWEAARKIDINGHDAIVDSEGPLAEAAWAKQRLGRAAQALPNGFCGLPVQQTCPHANACLTCPMFLTTSEFLPQHQAQREQVLQIMTAAEAKGHRRLLEMNQQVLTNLDRIITTLREDPSPDSERVTDAS
jgi:integrase